eukprot:2771742-Amphidinium_carterae.1
MAWHDDDDDYDNDVDDDYDNDVDDEYYADEYDDAADDAADGYAADNATDGYASDDDDDEEDNRAYLLITVNRIHYARMWVVTAKVSEGSAYLVITSAPNTVGERD